MSLNFEVVFKNMPEVKSIKRHLEKEVEVLEKNFDGIESCRVYFDLPYHHRYPGNIYYFKIEVNVPGHELKVERCPSAEGSSSDIFALIHEAFDETLKKLESSKIARKKMNEAERSRPPEPRRRPEAGASF
jgi:ribosome-associated translation inhibitor RaiA